LWAAHDLSAKMGAQAWAARHPNPFGKPEWRRALDPQQGFRDLYQQMFGDAWERARRVEPLIPPGLRQLELILPFEPGRLWSFTSGPHKAWESESSLAALDFAPASDQTGCLPTDAWVVAVGDGPIVRAGPGLLIQDLDGQTPSDGKEQTGWAILYMHIAEQERVAPGAYLRAGQRIGRPSCEGGPATGTHLHIARKYNGVWMAAGGALPFVLDGWTVQAGQKPYEGTLVNDGHTVVAHPYASFETHISRPEFVPSLKPRMLPNLGSDEN
jgi:murein DD-endopeptidase MepM/ murein hydrolase activator NlpD